MVTLSNEIVRNADLRSGRKDGRECSNSRNILDCNHLSVSRVVTLESGSQQNHNYSFRGTTETGTNQNPFAMYTCTIQ